MSIYVEREIEATPEAIWALTQEPALHQRWDVRFTRIAYVPKARASDPQEFVYETRLGFGLAIRGTGTTRGERDGPDGASTSALVFGSDDPLSLIRKGSGYWRYEPTKKGVRFITRYDYAVRWGWAGWLLDRAVFRPLMAWGTAWSFDRLAVWATRGTAPETSRVIAVTHAVARLTVGFVWLYQGLMPKLLGPHAQELSLTVRAGIGAAWARGVVMGLGAVEVLLGVLGVLLWRRRWPLAVSALAMTPALVIGMRAGPELVGAPFNVVVINVMTAALSVIAALLIPEVVSAGNCRWQAYAKAAVEKRTAGRVNEWPARRGRRTAELLELD